MIFAGVVEVRECDHWRRLQVYDSFDAIDDVAAVDGCDSIVDVLRVEYILSWRRLCVGVHQLS